MNQPTLLELQNLSIENIITRLYQEAKAPLPTESRPVVPLHRLMEGAGLNHAELSNLSSRAAMDYLIRRDVLTKPWRGANSEALAGFLYAKVGCAWLFVRREDPVARRRFFAAHQLGHYVLHFPRALAHAEAQGQSEVELIELLPPPSNSQADELSQGKLILENVTSNFMSLLNPHEMEHEADSFAAQLLMPESLVRSLAEPFMPHCSDVDLARRLSTELLVSRAAMLVRLRHLGLLRGETALLD